MISEFALFVFTTLGGLGAGLYAAAAVFPVQGKRTNLAVPLIALVCLAIGGGALMLHLGHPERMLNAFANPASGITQEALASMVFGVVVVIDLVLAFFKGQAPRVLRVVGAVAGLALCCIMGLAYYAYEAVAAWHAWITVAFFLVVDVAVGFLLRGSLDEEIADNRTITQANMVLAVIAAIVFVVEGAYFGMLGLGVAPFFIAAVLGIASAALLFRARRYPSSLLNRMAFAALFVAVIVARYAFYAVV